MSFFRNKEVAGSIVLYFIIGVVVTITAFAWDTKFGIFTLCVCMAFFVLYFVTTYQRYKKIRELSYDIDRILHGEEHIDFGKYAEGELAVLESEIYKMTVRLREQQQSLLDDKKYLADSIADISHQIRTPLTSINLLVSFLSEPDITEEKRQKTIRELYGLLSRIDWLIATLLKISKLDAGTIIFKKEKVTIEELLRKSVEPLLIPIELRAQELCIQSEGDFSGDVEWTSEAIGNIVKNCMEHTAGGGKIEINARENAIYREIKIADNGSGIADEDLPHIFERFYKGKNSSENSFGVGLALARMIIVKQNGTIKVENRSSGGALFTIRFYKEM